MITRVYIGAVSCDKYDFDKPKEWPISGFLPKRLSELIFADKLYWDILGEMIEKRLNVKKTEWGCFALKLSKNELIDYLNKEKYKKEFFTFSDGTQYLLDTVKDLSNGEYLLTALESDSDDS